MKLCLVKINKTSFLTLKSRFMIICERCYCEMRNIPRFISEETVHRGFALKG